MDSFRFGVVWHIKSLISSRFYKLYKFQPQKAAIGTKGCIGYTAKSVISYMRHRTVISKSMPIRALIAAVSVKSKCGIPDARGTRSGMCLASRRSVWRSLRVGL